MAGPARRWRLVGLLILAGCLTAGCDLPSLVYFLATGFQEPQEEAGDMKLAVKGQEVKVAVLTYCPLERGSEFIDLDRDFSGLFIRQLQQACKENKEKITLVPHAKIQAYKSKHPNWFLNVADAAKGLDVDKVIYLEVQSLSLYEQGSANQLYRGRASVSVKLFDLHKPDDYQLEKTYSCEYPTARGPIDVNDKKPREFYLEFLNYVVKHLSWYFTAHPVSADITCD
jgi:hypothetical protein